MGFAPSMQQLASMSSAINRRACVLEMSSLSSTSFLEQVMFSGSVTL